MGILSNVQFSAEISFGVGSLSNNKVRIFIQNCMKNVQEAFTWFLNREGQLYRAW